MTIYNEFCNKTSNKLEPKIYVACLAAYNSGYLHGEWIDARQDEESIWHDIKNMLSKSPIPHGEEWAIHDYEGFGEYTIYEYTAIKTIISVSSFLQEYDELGSAVLSHTCGDIDEAVRLLEECYHGEHDSEEDFAENLAGDIMQIPDYLSYYIDYKAMARDWFISDYFSIEINGFVHVFSNY